MADDVARENSYDGVGSSLQVKVVWDSTLSKTKLMRKPGTGN